jgi:HK97 family phage major capsid protein
MKEVLEAVQALDKKMDDSKAETKSAFDKKIEELNGSIANEKKEFEAKVKELNEELSKKGASLEEIQKEVKEMKAKAGRFKGSDANGEKKTSDLIAEAIELKFAEIKDISAGAKVKLEMKAVGNMTPSASLTGNVIATYDMNPAVRGRRKINIRDLIPVIASATGVWKFYSENSPAPADGSIDNQSAPGASKNQIDYALTENTVTCKYMSGYVRFDKGMAADLPFLQTFIANEMVEDYKRSESQSFFTTLTAAATGSTTTGASVLAEKYIDWIANLLANDYSPSAIVTTALNWSTILKTKPNDYDVPGGIVITPEGGVLFAGIPLIAQNNIAAGKTLIGDFTKAAIIQQEGLSINFYEQDQDNVIKNLITARIEARVALATLRPDAFVYN